MKVICINDCGWVLNNKYFSGPKKLDICTVIEEKDGFYVLEEYGDGKVYDKEEFIMLHENKQISFEKIKTDVPMFSN